MDAHKWFFQPYEAGCLLVKDVGADLRHGRVPARRVAGHGARSPRGDYIRKSPQLELLNPASLGIVCFRINPAGAGLDEPALESMNRTVLARVFW